MADFTGFYFNNEHSSTYGLTRISGGDRYNEDLLPDFENRTIETAGRDGDLYEGRRFKNKTIPIKCAFDNLSEQQLHDIRIWLSSEDLKELRLDERPYKMYLAKLESKPTFNYICFEAENGQRIYKGELDLSFISYNPFGICRDNSVEYSDLNGFSKNVDGRNWQILDNYMQDGFIKDENINEWARVSKLRSNKDFVNLNKFKIYQKDNTSGNIKQESIDIKNNKITYVTNFYNPGDMNADFELFFNMDVFSTFSDNSAKRKQVTGNVTIQILDDKEGQLPLEQIKLLKVFKFDFKDISINNNILLNTRNHSLTIIKDYQNGKPIKELRYDLIKSTDWPKIPSIDGIMKIDITLSGVSDNQIKISPYIQLYYDYLYY